MSSLTPGPEARQVRPALPARRDARRRDRRGRGLRGPLLDPRLPAATSRAERFDEAVLHAVERIESRWSKELSGLEFAVEDVPPSDPAPWEFARLALGRYFPAHSGLSSRIVVYRRPIEERAVGAGELEGLVRDVLVEQVSQVLSRSPQDIDPDYGSVS